LLPDSSAVTGKFNGILFYSEYESYGDLNTLLKGNARRTSDSIL